MQSATEAGFTLIELMIVIAILAILLAIAVPAYQDYTTRARVSEALNMAGPAKNAVVEAFHAQGAVPDQAATGLADTETDYVESIVIAGNGSGTVTITTRNTGALAPVVIRLEPNLATGKPTTWTCELESGEPRHAPASCR